MKFNGLNVLISGASAGIGAEFAKQLHAKGCDLILIARRAERLNEACDVFNKVRSNSARFLALDLARDESYPQVEEIIRSGRIDILINNAGRGSYGYFEKIDLESELNLVRLNILSYLRLSNLVIPQMKQRRSGAIINLSSIAAFQPLPFMSTYAASKSFNFSHSLALRYELQPFGIRVLAVCPGPTKTEFGQVARMPGEMFEVSGDNVGMVVRSSLQALERNTAYVVTGLRAKIMAWLSWFSPRTLSCWVLARGLKPRPANMIDKSH